MFVLPGVLGWVTSLGAMLRGSPADKTSDLIGISPRINLHVVRNKNRKIILVVIYILRYNCIKIIY